MHRRATIPTTFQGRNLIHVSAWFGFSFLFRPSHFCFCSSPFSPHLICLPRRTCVWFLNLPPSLPPTLLPPSLPPSLSLCTLRCRYSKRRTRRRVASGSRTLTSAGPPSSPVWHRHSPLTKETRWGRGRGRSTSGSTCASEEARQCHVQANS